MDFSNLNKSSADSFHRQKSLIKRVLAGKVANCPQCADKLTVKPAENGLHLVCKKGCTDILLDTN